MHILDHYHAANAEKTAKVSPSSKLKQWVVLHYACLRNCCQTCLGERIRLGRFRRSRATVLMAWATWIGAHLISQPVVPACVKIVRGHWWQTAHWETALLRDEDARKRRLEVWDLLEEEDNELKITQLKDTRIHAYTHPTHTCTHINLPTTYTKSNHGPPPFDLKRVLNSTAPLPLLSPNKWVFMAGFYPALFPLTTKLILSEVVLIQWTLTTRRAPQVAFSMVRWELVISEWWWNTEEHLWMSVGSLAVCRQSHYTAVNHSFWGSECTFRDSLGLSVPLCSECRLNHKHKVCLFLFFSE